MNNDHGTTVPFPDECYNDPDVPKPVPFLDDDVDEDVYADDDFVEFMQELDREERGFADE